MIINVRIRPPSLYPQGTQQRATHRPETQAIALQIVGVQVSIETPCSLFSFYGCNDVGVAGPVPTILACPRTHRFAQLSAAILIYYILL